VLCDNARLLLMIDPPLRTGKQRRTRTLLPSLCFSRRTYLYILHHLQASLQTLVSYLTSISLRNSLCFCNQPRLLPRRFGHIFLHDATFCSASVDLIALIAPPSLFALTLKDTHRYAYIIHTTIYLHTDTATLIYVNIMPPSTTWH
jgi:hypothetical protein